MTVIDAFVGKGGVGKTSIASTYALLCAERGKTALASTDMMPSLSYIFKAKEKNLTIYEIKEDEIAREWIARYGREVREIAANFFDSTGGLLEHIAHAPGIAEEFMISKIVEVEESGKFDFVIWDTPASSSTMHLLLLENQFYSHLSSDIKFYLKLKDAFKVSKVLDILEEWKNLASHTWDKVRKSNFYVVKTEDELSTIQAAQIKKELGKMGIKVRNEITNRAKKNRAGICIPELEGDARDIVDQMKPYIRQLLKY